MSSAATCRPAATLLAAACFATICLIATCVLSRPAAAQAPGRPEAAAKLAAAAGQVHPAAEREDEATCSRARRRLWLEGEGWVVRRITTCR